MYYTAPSELQEMILERLGKLMEAPACVVVGVLCIVMLRIGILKVVRPVVLVIFGCFRVIPVTAAGVAIRAVLLLCILLFPVFLRVVNC